MAICPHKTETNYSDAMCALRYRNAQLEKCFDPKTKPGFGDSFCKTCLIGKKLNETDDNDTAKEVSRSPQGRTINTDSNICIDSKREYELEETQLFAVINTKGRNTNAPRLANKRGEIVGKVCSICLKPKWLSDYYTPDYPGICKTCSNSRPRKKKINITEDKEFVKTPIKDIAKERPGIVFPKVSSKEVSYTTTEHVNDHDIKDISTEKTDLDIVKPQVTILDASLGISKEKPVNKEKLRNIINDCIDIKIMELEKRIVENISKQVKDLKRSILLEIGTALLLEAKK